MPATSASSCPASCAPPAASRLRSIPSSSPPARRPHRLGSARRGPYFANADVVFHAADWAALIEAASDAEPGIAGMRAARDAGRLTTVDTSSHQLAPGLTIEHAPGHPPGSCILVAGSGSERAYLLGDVVQHPLQLNDTSISFLTDADAAKAALTRMALLRRLEEEDAAIGMDHFPGTTFQRIAGGSTRIWQPQR